MATKKKDETQTVTQTETQTETQTVTQPAPEQVDPPEGIAEKLQYIQQRLIAPKGLYNKFGEYSYRSNEGILAAVKPLLAEVGCILLQADEIVEIGGRVYVMATSLIMDMDTKEKLTAAAYAREPLQKKKMDDSQITGAASSYARKYSLQGLLLLDDNRDPDHNSPEDNEQPPPQRPQRPQQPQPPPQSMDPLATPLVDVAWDLFDSVKDRLDETGRQWALGCLHAGNYQAVIDWINTNTKGATNA